MTIEMESEAGGPGAPPTNLPRGVVLLLERVIDYAGLFPPAKLEMKATVEAYARGLVGPSAWMLERLVVPAGRLGELEQAAADLLPKDEEGDPWPISALVAAAGDAEALVRDLDRVDRFNAEHCEPARGLAIVDAIELRAGTPEEIDAALDHIPGEIFPFFELPADRDPRGLVTALVGGDAGAKIRTGGVTPELYPTPEAVAEFIRACSSVDVPFKATAGLHHPWRHRSSAVGCEEFGFLNVFAAGVLARARRLDAEELEQVLVQTGPGRLAFDDEGMRWDGDLVTCEEIEDARLASVVSFGSCSFDEPAEELPGALGT